MASHCSLHILNLRFPPLVLLTMVSIITWHFAITESAQTQLRGEVGGNVTFHCPVVKQRTFTFLYFQRGLTFINGYHASKPIKNIWENTKLDNSMTTLHMYSLNVSHIGDYQCHIMYSLGEIAETDIGHLSVTANYSKPSLTPHCSGESHHLSCLVTCAAHGGYPGTEVTWNIPRSQMWKVVNSSEMSDPDTMLVNTSSTANINCSNGEVTSLSCFVGDVSSDVISVCKHPPDGLPSHYVVAAAICLVLVFVALVLYWRCKKRQRAPVAERRFSECEEEVTGLNSQAS